MTDWKRKKLWLEEENDQVHTQKNYCIEGYTKNNLKQRPEQKNPKTMDHYPKNGQMWDTDPCSGN